MWKQLLHKKIAKDGTTQYSSYVLNTCSYHDNTTDASCSYELPSEVYSPDGTIHKRRRLLLTITPTGHQHISDTQTTGPMNSTFEDKYNAVDLTESLNFSTIGTSQLQVSELTKSFRGYHTSPCTLLTSVTSIGEETTRDRQTPYQHWELGKRPPCIGQEASPPKVDHTGKRLPSHRITAQTSAGATLNQAERSAESDTTMFMKKPINRHGLITNKRRCQKHKAIGQKLKQLSKQFHVLQQCGSKKQTLAIL